MAGILVTRTRLSRSGFLPSECGAEGMAKWQEDFIICTLNFIASSIIISLHSHSSLLFGDRTRSLLAIPSLARRKWRILLLLLPLQVSNRN